MVTAKEIKDYLSRADKLIKTLDKQRERIAELRLTAAGRSYTWDGIRSGGRYNSRSPQAVLIERISKEEEKLYRAECLKMDMEAEALELIDRLKDDKLRGVLTCYHVFHYSQKRIADLYEYEERRIYSFRGEAYKQLCKIVSKEPETERKILRALGIRTDPPQITADLEDTETAGTADQEARAEDPESFQDQKGQEMDNNTAENTNNTTATAPQEAQTAAAIDPAKLAEWEKLAEAVEVPEDPADMAQALNRWLGEAKNKPGINLDSLFSKLSQSIGGENGNS